MAEELLDRNNQRCALRDGTAGYIPGNCLCPTFCTGFGELRVEAVPEQPHPEIAPAVSTSASGNEKIQLVSDEIDISAIVATWSLIHLVSICVVLREDLRKNWVPIQSVRPHVCGRVEPHRISSEIRVYSGSHEQMDFAASPQHRHPAD